METVLIVEDDGLLAFELVGIVEQYCECKAISVSSVRQALIQLELPVAFALLDINVQDGTTYELARLLMERSIPFAFTSGANRDALPHELIGARFIQKPCSVSAIVAAIRDGVFGHGSAAARRS